MTEDIPQFEFLLERATEYGKTSLELVKLKAIDKISDGISSFFPLIITFALVLLFTIFINIGLALWLGEILGKVYLGFFVIGGFYLLIGLIIHFALHKSIKNKIRNFIISQALK